MGDVVNLRLARKARSRDDAVKVAAENRVKHGLTKEQRAAEKLTTTREAKTLEGHKLNED